MRTFLEGEDIFAGLDFRKSSDHFQKARSVLKSGDISVNKRDESERCGGLWKVQF